MPQNRNIKLSGLQSCCFKLINNFENENSKSILPNNFKLTCKDCSSNISLNNNNWQKE